MDSTVPRPRLCHLIKREDFSGYGFNLHAEKGKAGQYIGKVDDGSPAAFAGLRDGDRIVEVNGINIGNENHQQVVTRIKAVPNETKFLVVDEATDAYYREAKIVIHGELANVHHVEQSTTENKSTVSNGTHRDEDDSKYELRLCHLKIWPDYGGYGFNLHAEKGKPSQFIGKVDPNSPAESAGMREGDRIVEVNGDSVLDLGHSEVVAKIKSNPTHVTMLLADPDTEKYFKEKGVTMSSTLSNVSKKVCPDSNPHTAVSAKPAEEPHHPRLCRIKSRDDGKGFGFNMQADKTKSGQFIGKVDPDSPADASGLRPGDRIIEVNGVNIEHDTHKQVVEKIKASPNETTLLVVDPTADEYFKSKGVVITTNLVAVAIIANGGDADKHSVSSSSSDSDDDKKVEAKELEKSEHDEKEAEKEAKDESDDETTKVAAVVVIVEDGEVIAKVDVDKSSDHDADNKSDHGDGDRKSEHSDKSSEHSVEEPVTTGMYVLVHDDDIKDDRDDSDKEDKNEESVVIVKNEESVVVVETVTSKGDDEVTYSVVVKKEKSDDSSSDSSDDEEKKKVVVLVHSMSAEEEVKETVEKIKAEVAAEHSKKAEPSKSLPPLSTTSKPKDPEPVSPKSPVTISGIEFAATAEEARQKMTRKQKSSRGSNLSMKDKYELFQKL